VWVDGGNVATEPKRTLSFLHVVTCERNLFIAINVNALSR